VTNTGPVAGREVVQFYVSVDGRVVRPPRELKAFGTIALQPGGSDRVEVFIPREELAYWETRTHSWTVEGGDYEIAAAASSRDIRLTTRVTVEGDEVRAPLTADSSISELMANPVTAAVLGRLMQRGREKQSNAAAEELGIDTAATIAGIPVGKLRSLSGGQGLTRTQLDDLLARANNA
jgi:beta-glucosidase